MVSVTFVRHNPLFRVEGLLRFTSKLACRYLREFSRTFVFIFPIGAPWDLEKGHFWVFCTKYGAQNYVSVFRSGCRVNTSDVINHINHLHHPQVLPCTMPIKLPNKKSNSGFQGHYFASRFDLLFLCSYCDKRC